MTRDTEHPSTEQHVKEAHEGEDTSAAEQAVLNQEEALKSGAENPG